MKAIASLSWLALLPLAAWQSPSKAVNPRVSQIVEGVSEKRIEAIIKKLESFETRNTFSDGAAAARNWIKQEFEGYSPRLQVRFDPHSVEKKGNFFRDGEVVNVVAVLPGRTDRQIIVSGHYDSLNMTARNNEKAATAPAPGVCDDGSGTAAVMELARVMSAHEWDNTVVFIAFDAEEYGLLGSTRYANQAKKDGHKIEAVLNNDIIGTDTDGRGRTDNRAVRVFSGDPADSPSRQLARYVREVSARYLPAMRVDTIFLPDRFGRGGDHTPFHRQGFAGVRFTTPAENYAHQHTATDTFANVSVPYTAMVARVNAAAAASLALAPKAPVTSRVATSGAQKGRPGPNLSRGTGRGGYDARLGWSNENPDPDLAGYAIVWRATTSPYWEHEIWVGNVSEYTLKDVSIDDRVFGVKAIDKEGNESMVAAYGPAPFTAGRPPAGPVTP